MVIIKSERKLNHPYLEESLINSIHTEYESLAKINSHAPLYHELKNKILNSFVSNLCMNIQNHDMYDYYEIKDIPDLIDFARGNRIKQYIPSDEVLLGIIKELNYIFVFGEQFINAPFESVW